MSDNYFTYRGTRKAAEPIEDYNKMAFGGHWKETLDDGKIILWAGDHTPLCSDCGRGHLQWAEAGYVPWHRVCDVCGSHWHLHPIKWGPAKPQRLDGPQREWTGQYRCGHAILPDHDRPNYPVSWCVECDDESTPIYRTLPPIEFVRWINGKGEMPLDRNEPLGDTGKTWGDLLLLVTPEMWVEAEEQKQRMAGMTVVPCAWARRARFYRSH